MHRPSRNSPDPAAAVRRSASDISSSVSPLHPNTPPCTTRHPSAENPSRPPTAAAAFLIDHLVEVKNHIDEAETAIVNYVTRTLDRHHITLEALVEKITSFCRLLKQNGETQLMRHELQLQNSIQQQLLRERHRLEILSQRINAMDPKLLLQRGYSMTLVDGHIVKDAAQLTQGTEIETILAKGKVKSIVSA